MGELRTRVAQHSCEALWKYKDFTIAQLLPLPSLPSGIFCFLLNIQHAEQAKSLFLLELCTNRSSCLPNCLLWSGQCNARGVLGFETASRSFKHSLTPYPQQPRHGGNLKKLKLQSICRYQSTNLPLPRQLLEVPLVGRTLAGPRRPHSWTTWSFCSWGCCGAPSERRRRPPRGAGTRVCAGKCTLHIHPSTPQPPASGSVRGETTWECCTNHHQHSEQLACFRSERIFIHIHSFSPASGQRLFLLLCSSKGLLERYFQLRSKQNPGTWPLYLVPCG